MVNYIFPHYFYSIIDPPNKKELLKIANNAKPHNNQHFGWGDECTVKVQKLVVDEFQRELYPSLKIFLDDLGRTGGMKSGLNLSITVDEAWKNTYTKGSFQELHDHLPYHQLAAVLFLDDHQPGFSELYFQDRFFCELTLEWRRIHPNEGRYKLGNVDKGNIVFFPSHLLHGVSPHNSYKRRRTIAFNIRLVESEELL